MLFFTPLSIYAYLTDTYTQVTLLSFHNKYLCAEPQGNVVANRDAAKGWEQWTIQTDDKGVTFKSTHGKYLSAQPDGSVVADR